MSKIRLWLLCALLSACHYTSIQHPVTATLEIGEATCSGTVVGPHTILSAKHCFVEEESDIMFELPPPPATSFKMDGYKVNIKAMVFDENDHVLIKVDHTFKDVAKLAKTPEVGEKVHYWGNPAGIANVYREGYVTSYHQGDMVMDVNGFFGDSGAGIFNSDGRVVGVMSYIEGKHHQHLEFHLMGAYPLEFTALQYSMMGVTPP